MRWLLTLALAFMNLTQQCTFAEGERCGETHLTDADCAALKSASSVIYYESGDSNQPSPSWLVFQKFRRFGKLATDQIKQILADGTPAAKIYAVVLLKDLDKKQSADALAKLQSSNEKVFYIKGCMAETTTTGKLATRLVKGEEVVKIVPLENPK